MTTGDHTDRKGRNVVSTKWKRDGDVRTSKEDEDSVEKLQRPFLDNCNFFAQMFDDILSHPFHVFEIERSFEQINPSPVLFQRLWQVKFFEYILNNEYVLFSFLGLGLLGYSAFSPVSNS